MLVENLGAILDLGLQPEVYFSGHTLDRLSAAEAERTGQALGRHHIPVTFHGPFLDLNPGGIDEKVREVTLFRFGQILDLVPCFQPRTIVLHPGYDRWRYDGDIDLWLKKSLITWKPLAEKAEKLSVRIALENVFDHIPTPLKRLLDEVDSPFLGYCMDVGHGNLFSEIPLTGWVDILGNRLFETHLHDNHGTADEHLPIGRGNIDFSALFFRIKEKQLQPIFTIEPHEFEYLSPNLIALEKFLR